MQNCLWSPATHQRFAGPFDPLHIMHQRLCFLMPQQQKSKSSQDCLGTFVFLTSQRQWEDAGWGREESMRSSQITKDKLQCREMQ